MTRTPKPKTPQQRYEAHYTAKLEEALGHARDALSKGVMVDDFMTAVRMQHATMPLPETVRHVTRNVKFVVSRLDQAIVKPGALRDDDITEHTFEESLATFEQALAAQVEGDSAGGNLSSGQERADKSSPRPGPHLDLERFRRHRGGGGGRFTGS